MKTPDSIQKMLDWQKAHAGKLRYSQTDAHRLSTDDAHMASPTDCSGLIAKVVKKFAGLDIGTYTGNECTQGTLITRSKANARRGTGMLPGDCILFDWDGNGGTNGSWDHIAMYAGDGRIWNHGGPGTGPNLWSLQSNVDAAGAVMVRRFVPWPKVTPPAPAKPKYTLPKGHFLGEVKGHSTVAHDGAANATYRAQIRWFQNQLISHGYVPGVSAGSAAARDWADGIYGHETTIAVNRAKARHGLTQDGKLGPVLYKLAYDGKLRHA